MPKEVIYGKGPVYGPESPAVSIVDVRWSREAGYVEIGSRVVHRADHSDYVPTEEERPGSNGEPLHGLFMSLDRAQINRLIKQLRRARDSAFGRDE